MPSPCISMLYVYTELHILLPLLFENETSNVLYFDGIHHDVLRLS